jgi:beta-aspartyl-peptidase (threonine type)
VSPAGGAGPVVVASANALGAVNVAWEILAAGGSVVDAVEAAVRVVEDDPNDHTVGYGGYPNLAGEVELDASIMEGATRRAGAVGALRGFRQAVTVARAVMERSPHVLIAGDGAARLARELGLEEQSLLTDEAAATWRAGIPEGEHPMLSAARLATDPERAAGTVNVIARDATGRLASAVSTSGWAWKYPGRLGDSPVVGAGNYCDDRYGAAACTGWGELAVRAATAHTVVSALAAGVALEEAGRRAIADLTSLGEDPAHLTMHLVALDARGRHAGFTTRAGSTYAVRTMVMARAELAPRTEVGLS